MNPEDFTLSFTVSQSPQQVFDAINDVRAWWSEEFDGSALAVGDEFSVRFGDVHYSKHKVTELVPGKKVAWLVTDSRLNFLQDKAEWTGTTNSFEIAETDEGTEVRFTHCGLVPAIQCFKDCSNGWTHYLKESLEPFIATGNGQPNILDNEIKVKAAGLS
jgi:uncharacterized protein YndB with AHSA1/START domain